MKCENLFIDVVPKDFSDKLPVSVFFTKGYPLNNDVVKVNMFFVPSDFYMTRKMNCFTLYKPSIL